MSKLKEYIIKDNKTQYNEKRGYDENVLYGIYGVNETGILFERDLNNPNRILRHYSNGLKGIDYNMFEEDSFFRKNYKGSHFWASYEDYDDFNYSKEPKQLSKEEMINVLKEYIYLHNPDIGSETMMGWTSKDGDNSPIHDPNWCYALIQLDDKKDYTVIKRKDTVKLFKGNVSMYYFDDHDELAIVKFKLERDLYEKAIKLNCLKMKMATRMFGKINISKFKEFINLESEITIKLQSKGVFLNRLYV